MNFHHYTAATGLEGNAQTIAQGPVAALELIKNLGTNGGGFFNVNGAHPFENPTALTNFLEMLAIAALPAALTHTFGRMVGRPRQDWVLFWVMTVMFVAGLAFCAAPEQTGNRAAARAALAPGGNMEGKEARFGIGASVLTAVVTSNGATGSTNSSQDSFMPLSGMVPLVNMLLGEMVFGGLGTRLYSILMVALVGLFIAGLMVSRTPEYLGKQLGPREVKLITLYTIAAPFAILLLTALALTTKAALALTTKAGRAGPSSDGPHGFTEVFYAYTSCFANNGQTFAGLNGNTPFYNTTMAVAMMAGRFALAIPALALAGLFARQGRRAPTTGTLPTDTLQFASLIIGTAIIVVGLSFLPALALGPVVEHLLMPRG